MRISTILAITLLAVAAGCQTSGGHGTARQWSGKIKEIRYNRGDGQIGEELELTQDVTINGVACKAGQHVIGWGHFTRTDQKDWWLPPVFDNLYGNYEVQFGHRIGAPTWVRIHVSDETPPVEMPTSYTKVMLLEYIPGGGRNERDRVVGIDNINHRVSVLDMKSGDPVVTFDNVPGENPEEAIDVLASNAAIMVHHDGYDRVYSSAGKPLSPEVPPMWKSRSYNYYHYNYGVTLDEKRGLVWLMRDDGRMDPKPDDLVGLQNVSDGWLVWWKTADGERCVHLDMVNPAEHWSDLMASRNDAKWLDWVGVGSLYPEDKVVVRKPAGQTSYEIFRGDFPVTEQRFASVEEAKAFLNPYWELRWQEKLRKTDEMVRQRQAQELAAMEAKTRAMEAQRKAEKEAAERELATARANFDDAMARGEKGAARLALLKLYGDSDRWTRYIKKYGLDGGDNTSDSIGYARAKLGGADPAVLDQAVRDSRPAYQAPQSDWDYFWNGPRDGSVHVPLGSNYQPDPRLTTEGVINHLKEVRQQNELRWIRGEQNWK